MDLIFTPGETPPPLDPESSAVEVWRDNAGRACAYGATLGSSNWMHIYRIGSFRFSQEEGNVRVVPLPGTREADVVDTFHRTVLPMALQLMGREVLHGSAVTTPHGVLAFCAVSETGKSTLAYAMSKRGHALYADDAIVFEAHGGDVLLNSIPFEVRLRTEAAEHFSEAPREEVRVTGRSVPPREDDTKLAAVCVLERVTADDPSLPADGPPVSFERLSPSAAFTALLPHAYCFSLRDPDRKGRMMRQYMTLAAITPVISMRFRAGLPHLPEIVAALESELEAMQPAVRP